MRTQFATSVFLDKQEKMRTFSLGQSIKIFSTFRAWPAILHAGDFSFEW